MIATAILSLEILASDFSGWSAMFPDARLAATKILDCRVGGLHISLMEQYLYPPKYINPAIIAALMPPPVRVSNPTDLYRTLAPEISGEKLALGYASSVRKTLLRDMKRQVIASADQA